MQLEIFILDFRVGYLRPKLVPFFIFDVFVLTCMKVFTLKSVQSAECSRGERWTFCWDLWFVASKGVYG